MDREGNSCNGKNNAQLKTLNDSVYWVRCGVNVFEHILFCIIIDFGSKAIVWPR